MIAKADVKNIYPLSPMQEGMLFHALHDAGGAYIEQLSYRIVGNIDLNLFRAAWEELVRRHDVLRTIFVHKDVPRPLQIVLNRWRVDFSTVELRGTARDEAESRISVIKEQDRATPFNLAKGPLMRVRVLSLADNEAEVVWSHHHIILDGWSAGIVQGELLEIYAALKQGRGHTLAASAPFSGYITWIGKQDQEASRRFWQNYLKGYTNTAGIPRFTLRREPHPPISANLIRNALDFPPPFQGEGRGGDGVDCVISASYQKQPHPHPNLPLEGEGTKSSKLADMAPPPPASHLEGGGLNKRGSLILRIDSRKSEALAALAAANGVTLNVLIQALWGVLLCRLNGTNEAVFAATVSGRPDELPGIEEMVGLFINAVPVRIRLDGSETFTELLTALQRDTLASSRHHWCSLADIQAESALKQTLLDHILIFESFPFDERLVADERSGVRGFTITGSEIRENTNYPFELSIIPGHQIEFKMGYVPSIYSDEQIERVAWSLEHLVDCILENRSASLAGLSILSHREKDYILNVFNRPHGTVATETVADILERQVFAHPDSIALVFESVQLSYRELNEAANRVANQLQRQCLVQPDQVVGILMDRSERMMAGLLGIIKSGAAYLPLDPAFPAARISYMLEDSGCRALLTERAYRGGLTGISPDAVIIELDQLPDAPATDPLRCSVPESLLYLIYTSGSTGLPKGVMLEQRNVISFNRNMAQVYGLGPRDTILALTTITFDISVLELICSLMSGMKVVLASDAIANNPGRAAALLGTSGVNVLQITPSRLKLMLEEADLSILSGLKALLIGGEPLSPHLFERLKAVPDVALFNVYGPTEATIWSTTKKLNNADLTIGVPLVDEDVLILTPDGSQIVPIGVWGELCIGGQGLARGYWNRPELTLDRFIPHPVRPGERIYRTGDFGRFLPDGDIQCGGRMDNQVKVRGYRIETGEIEQNLLKIPGIREAVAHIVEIDGLNEIAAYMVPDGDRLPSPSELRQRLSEYLPEYMLPTYYVALESVPLTPNGKTDRKALPLPTGRAAVSVASGAVEYIPPRTETEAALVAIWQRILGVEQVGVNDNFFELGGHSIKAIRIASAIAKELGQEIPLSLIFQNPLLSSLAAALSGTSAVDQALLFPLPPQRWYETSPGQRRLWILQQMAPDSAAYNMPVALKLMWHVDLAALTKSVTALVERHEPLRTIFPEQDGLPVQVILPAAGEYLTLVDLSGDADPWDQALQASRRTAGTPFDLSVAPLFRAVLYRTSQDESLLLLLMHHINGDAWTWGILLRELAEQYHLHATGRTPHSPIPLVQYKEWAHYQNKAMASGIWETMRQYWHGALAGANTPLNLPTDLPRPVVRRDGGDSLLLTLPPQTVMQLEEMGRRHGATLFMVLLALLKTLLFRMSGQEEITVGIPVAGRPVQQLEEMTGFFVNTLALRSRVTAERQFSRLLEQVRQTALDGYEHQLYPFDVLVSELAIPRDTGHAPLFDVMAVMQEEGERIPAFSNLAVSPVLLLTGTSRFDLVFNFSREDDGLTLELEYATDLFYTETAQRIAQRFRKLAESVVAAPETALKALDLLSEQEWNSLNDCGAGSSNNWPEEKSMVDLFRDQAERFPDAVAVAAGDQIISYQQLDQLSERCAFLLQKRHALQPEDVVGVMTGRTAYLPIALLGIMKGGGVYLPIDPDQPENRIRHIISDSGLRAIIVDDETESQVIRYADMVTVIEITTLMQEEPDGELQNRPAASSAAYIIYTSGSTGLPKGVLLQHGGFVNMILDQIRTFGIRPDDRCLLCSSFAFDGAMSEIFLALHSGAALVIARRDQTPDPELFARLLKETDATVATLTPVYLNALRTAGATLDPLRVIITAGEAAIATDVVYYARGKTVFNAYGPTEASVCSAIHRVDSSRFYHGSIPIGAPMANSQLLMLDDELQLVPFGVAGEICVAGPGLARGYLNRPELTAASFVPHPFLSGRRIYRTGDLGRRLHDGTVEFLGRRDEQVKVRGFRIECGEVERALLKSSALSGAVVVARGEGVERELVAFLLPNGNLDLGSLKAELAGQIPSFMMPSRFVQLRDFPLNANGKVDRKQLADMAVVHELSSGAGELPATSMEKNLAEIWEQILGRTGVCRHDSFFEIGGQSIAAIRVAAAIHLQYGIKLPLPALFQHATLSELALECERTAAFAVGYQEDLHLLLNRGGRRLIFAFPPINGYPIAYSRLAELLDDVAFHGFTFIESDDRLKRYAELIDELQPSGALVLFGYSSGGNLAFEMAKELERRGRIVSDLILFDSWKRLPNAPVTENLHEWIDEYSPDPALFGNLAELMVSPHIRDIAFSKLRSYLAFTESLTTEGIINGNIHLLYADASIGIEGLSQRWSDNTVSICSTYDGSGLHLDMLKEPWVANNASIVCGIVCGYCSSEIS